MLLKVLKRLTKGGAYSKKSISKELGIDESLFEQIIGQLQKLGYIKKEDTDCCSSGGGCSGCSPKGGCSCGNNHNIDINMWRVTDKGRSVISNDS